MAGSPKKAIPTKMRSPKKGGKRGKKNAGKRRRTRRETYGGYIYRVLKQVHPPRWNLDKSDEYHELLRRRPLRKMSIQKRRDWSKTRRCLRAKFRLQYDSCFQENWRSMLSAKEPKLLRSTRARSNSLSRKSKGPIYSIFYGHQNIKTCKSVQVFANVDVGNY